MLPNMLYVTYMGHIDYSLYMVQYCMWFIATFICDYMVYHISIPL